MKVHIPSPIQSYTGGRRVVEAEGATLLSLLQAVNEAHPGLMFRIIDEQEKIRTHITLYVNTEREKKLSRPLLPTDEVHIICALSGG